MTRPCSSVLVVAACALTGCMQWARDPAPPRLAAAQRVSAARVFLRGGAVVRLDQPRVVGDSLIGTVPRGLLRDTVAVALADIRQMDVERVHAGRTVFVLLLGAGVIVLAVAAAAGIGGGYPGL